MRFDSLEISNKLDIEHDSLKRTVKRYKISCSKIKTEVKEKGGRPTEFYTFDFQEFKVLLAFLKTNTKTAKLKKSIFNDTKFLEVYNNLEKEEKEGCLYLLEIGGKTKIGITTRFERRIRVLTNHAGIQQNEYKVEVVKSKDYKEHEKILHKEFSDKRICGEWFSVSIKEILENGIYKNEVF